MARARGKERATRRAQGAQGAKKSAKTAKDTTKGQKAPKTPKARLGQMSGLDAAAQVLAEADEPLSCKAIVERMLAAGLWATRGRTPSQTIYASITREIARKGDGARFHKVSPGRFELTR